MWESYGGELVVLLLVKGIRIFQDGSHQEKEWSCVCNCRFEYREDIDSHNDWIVEEVAKNHDMDLDDLNELNVEQIEGGSSGAVLTASLSARKWWW